MANKNIKNPALDLEKYDGTRRRSSALEAQGFPTISEPKDDIDDAILLKKQSVKRIFGYPITIPFIISNEFCERFSYYGMRTVLTIYMTEKLLMSNEEASDWYHEFVALCYATPLLGALIADVFIGKYLTILILSMVYCLGNAVMAITAVGKWFPKDDSDTTNIQPHSWGPLIGLQIIALGTGGIKPCVSSFGGDQFLKSEAGRVQRYFSMFYFSINAGSTVATLLTPELRSASCMGEETCFPLAFGIPAVFMVLAVVAFVLASKWYVKVPPLGNPIVDVAKVSWAMAFGKNPEVLYGAKKVSETKQLFRVLAVFIPFPFFWALFEQQGSRWIVQAKRMNGQLGDSITIKPDQMQVFNPLLILCLIPVFETLVYPLMKRVGLPTGAPFRMVAGMILVALSFVICGFVELSMEERLASYNAAHLTTYTLDTLPSEHQLHILTTIPQILVITCGEILCSITGLEFAYAYAPSSMKSVCQSFFLLTNAFGNVITIIFTKATKRDLHLYFMWAGIEVGAAILMFVITQKVKGPLEKFKVENSKDGPANTKDVQLETVDKK
ncbi:hypothetical protein ACHWQZ_G008026 [Mnemiopsis leidyi]